MRRRFGFCFIISLITVPIGTRALGDEPAPAKPPESDKQKTEQKLPAGIKAPASFKVTLFAAPPDVRYPACLTAAPTGEVFVGIDENGSLDAKADRGRVVRCIDDDGDGKADRFNVFATMDSPRGLIYDAGTLYVLHPPKLTAFHDDNGDRSRRAFRSPGQRHRLRPQFPRRRPHDQRDPPRHRRLDLCGRRRLRLHQSGRQGWDDPPAPRGGVARVRTDGTGLEQFSRVRRIYDVAIDPPHERVHPAITPTTAAAAGRPARPGHPDWPIWLSIASSLASRMRSSLPGRLRRRVPHRLVVCPGAGPPPGFGDALYTCEWGRSVVDRHPLEPKGAGFKAGRRTVRRRLPRPTDMDIDGRSQIYIASWREGDFVFDKPDVGYVIRVSPTESVTTQFPDLKAASDAQLVQHLAAPAMSSV